MENNSSTAQAGDLALIVSTQKKRFLQTLTPGFQLHTHRGIIEHNDMIGKDWGTEVQSHLGSSFIVLQPSLEDLLLEIKRNTQIMYPKDVGYILLKMNIGPGQRVIEAGSGSGAFTTALAHAVGPSGHVYSYDFRLDLQNLAQKNIEKVGYKDRVTFNLQDIGEGFNEQTVDAIFLDLPNPYDYLVQTRNALKKGGFFGTILPTVNQVSRMLFSLRKEKFSFIDICEILFRYYKNTYNRLRPTDRMVAHTGYLIFARPVAGFKEREELQSEEFAEQGFLFDPKS